MLDERRKVADRTAVSSVRWDAAGEAPIGNSGTHSSAKQLLSSLPPRGKVKVGAALLVVVASLGSPANAQQHVSAKRYVVASGHPAATEAGLAVLRRGGNAMDAAVATSLSMGVAAPYGSGVGGKLVMLYREAATGHIHCLEAVCVSPAKLDAEQFAHLPLKERRFGYTSVCVPGLPAGLWAAHQKWGLHDWSSLVRPAVELAEQGIEVNEELRTMIAPETKRLRNDSEAARLYLVDNDTPPVGTFLKNADLAHTLKLLSELGPRGFYEGETADRIIAAAQAHGSTLSHEDLRDYEPRFCEPMSVTFRGNKVFTCPPPQTGGVTVLLALKALEPATWKDVRPRDASYINSIGRVLLSIYPRVEGHVADVPAADASARDLLGENTVNSVRQEAETIDFAQPAPLAETPERLADDLADASTSHLVIADSDGNVVSLTQSLSFHFGASVVPPGTGVLLNNSMSNFSVTSSRSINYVAAGKRPRSTIAPIIVTRDDKPELALGIPGGQRIPTTTIQLMVDRLAFDTPLAEAFDQPRFHVRRPLRRGEKSNTLDMEGKPTDALSKELRDDGWRIVEQRSDGRYFGGGNAVEYRRDGTMLGVADKRRSNLAGGE
ncbi:MAG: gamma-glutamyltransferase family protein [Pirellulales bacterium]